MTFHVTLKRPDQEIMRTLLNKCPDSKFQEKAFLADWDETSLTEAEKFARNLEQSQLAQKRIKNSYGGYKVKKVTISSCKNCGRFHDAINCLSHKNLIYKKISKGS